MRAVHQSVASAEAEAVAYGYDITRGELIDMGEGFEHLWIWEYKHKHTSRACRIADLRSAQYKIQEGDRLPRIVGFVQLSEK